MAILSECPNGFDNLTVGQGIFRCLVKAFQNSVFKANSVDTNLPHLCIQSGATVFVIVPFMAFQTRLGSAIQGCHTPNILCQSSKEYVRFIF